jgi:hypothetical protein
VLVPHVLIQYVFARGFVFAPRNNTRLSIPQVTEGFAYVSLHVVSSFERFGTPWIFASDEVGLRWHFVAIMAAFWLE